MKKKILVSLGLMIIILFSGFYGMYVVKNHIFPYSIIIKYYPSNSNYSKSWDWSIGIYTGRSPFELANPKNIVNPILTAKSITDINTKFVADPFLIKSDSLYYMFFEVLNKQNNQGDIGLAESKDGFKWSYKKIIIDEPFHLSYPYVFYWEGNYYLIPESHQDLSVRLYKAVDFPTKWTFIGDILRGYHFADPSVIHFNNKWWLFVCTNENDNLNIYYADHLIGPWTQHLLNPVVKNNMHVARGGGRIFLYNNKLFRYAQDCSPTYGNQDYAFEITKLDTVSFEEKMVGNKSIIRASGSGWNSNGMHTIDPVYIGNGKWISSVDGY